MEFVYQTLFLTFQTNTMTKITKQNNFANIISIPQAKQLFGRGSFYNNDLYLIDNIVGNNLPQNCKETKCIVIIFCKKGKIRYDTNGTTIIAEENDILFLTNGQKVSEYKLMSPDYIGQAIFIDTKLMEEIEFEGYTNNCLMSKLQYTDKIKISSHDMFYCNILFAIICKALCDPTNQERINSAKSFTKGILQMVLSKAPATTNEAISPDERQYIEFINLVDEKKTQNLQVAEYCQELDISETHLNHIVHKFAGTTPLKYIHKRLITQICIIIENTSSKAMSNTKLAERIHFRSATELSRFFKRELHITLSKYRHLTPAERLHIIPHTILDQTSPQADLPRTYIQGD